MKTSNLILTGFLAVFACSTVVTLVASKGSVSIPEGVEFSGNKSTKSFDALPLKHLKVEGSIRVILTAGLPDFSIEADAGLLESLVDLDDDPETLHIKLPDGVKIAREEVIARISTPTLEQITLSGNPSIESTAPLNYNSISISASGGPNIDLDIVEADRVQVNASGGVDFNLAGATNELNIELSGGCSVDAAELKALIVNAQAAGGNSITVHADSLLTASGSGSTRVAYTGSPVVSFSSSGSGSITALE